MKPSVACLTALLRTLMDLDAFEPAVPTVDACWDATSAWWWTLSLLQHTDIMAKITYWKQTAVIKFSQQLLGL